MLFEFLKLLVVSVISEAPFLSGDRSPAYLAYACSVTDSYLRRLLHRVISWVWRRPATNSLPTGAVLHFCCRKQELMLENALLRQQLIVFRRQLNRPQLTETDRALLVLLVSRLRT